MVGMFAYSKAGHDKGTVYLIIREEGEYVYAADGALRTLARPKKKNRKHIQLIKKYRDTALREALLSASPVTDEQIKRAVKLYEQKGRQTEEA